MNNQKTQFNSNIPASTACTYNSLFLLSGPAAVADLAVKTHSTNSLSFRWSPPEGDFDGYELFLYRRDDSLQERRRVQPGSQQSPFQGLTPGAPYRMVVVTHSGEQSNQTSIWARTGKQDGAYSWDPELFCLKRRVSSAGGSGVFESPRGEPVGSAACELGSGPRGPQWLPAVSLQPQRLPSGQDAAGPRGQRLGPLGPVPGPALQSRGAESEQRAEQQSRHGGPDR